MRTSETILIVDGSPDSLAVMQQVIAKALPDLTLMTCQHPERVMSLLHDTDLAVVLLDVQMPGLDALELCRLIKGNPATQFASVILITPHDAEPKTTARGLELGADDFITRPINSVALSARVRSALRVHRAEREWRRVASDTLRQFESIVSSSSDMMALLGRDFTYLTVNDAYCSAVGRSRDEIVGHSVASVFGMEVFEKSIRPRAEDCMTGRRARYSEWIDFPATGRRFMDVEFSPYTDDDGAGIGFVINARDITERRLAEEKLADAERRSRAWLSNSPVCTKILDLDFNIQYMSKAGVEGLKIDDVTPYYGKPYPLHFFPDSFKTSMVSSLKRAKVTGETITQEAAVLDVEGNEIWYHSTIVPVKDDTDRVEYIMVISMDTTERKQAEESLRVSESRYRASFMETQRFRDALDKVPSHVYIKDIDSRYIYANRVTLDLFRCSAEELIGRDDSGFFPPDTVTRLREVDARVLHGETTNEEIEALDREGKPSTFLQVKSPMVEGADSDRIVGLVGISTDITKHKRAEEELERHRGNLEEQVLERTEKLRKTINLMAGRENRMAELKVAIRKLRLQLEEAGMKPVADDPMMAGGYGKDDGSHG